MPGLFRRWRVHGRSLVRPLAGAVGVPPGGSVNFCWLAVRDPRH
jgi:hypothetical protein